MCFSLRFKRICLKEFGQVKRLRRFYRRERSIHKDFFLGDIELQKWGNRLLTLLRRKLIQLD